MTLQELNNAALNFIRENPDELSGTLEDIRLAVESNIAEVIPNASVSAAAEFRQIAASLSTIIWIMANSQQDFKEYVNARTSVYRPATVRWFDEKIRLFQYDSTANEMDTLTITDEGIVQFQDVDESKQIIDAVSLTEDLTTGALQIKVAKENDTTGELEKLENVEKTALGVYVRNIKIPGILINIISQDPDIVNYDFTIYYDPFYTESSIQERVEDALDGFRKSFRFNNKIFDSDFIGLLEAIEGVKRVKKNTLQIKENGGSYEELTANQIVAGYFNYDESSSLTFTDFNELF